MKAVWCFSVCNQSPVINSIFVTLKVDACVSAAYKTAHPYEKIIRHIFTRNCLNHIDLQIVLTRKTAHYGEYQICQKNGS